jgi:hypothetical protein
MVEDNTFNCGFCVCGEPRKTLVGVRKYKITSNRPCSECLLPLLLTLEKGMPVEVPKEVKGWKI